MIYRFPHPVAVDLGELCQASLSLSAGELFAVHSKLMTQKEQAEAEERDAIAEAVGKQVSVVQK